MLQSLTVSNLTTILQKNKLNLNASSCHFGNIVAVTEDVCRQLNPNSKLFLIFVCDNRRVSWAYLNEQ